MHLDDGAIQRLLLDDEHAAEASAHLAGCAECADRLRAARLEDDELGRLFRSLDEPAPHVTPARIVARARRAASPWLRRAAVAVLAVGVGGAAWAAPGSPLPGWLALGDEAAPQAGQPTGVRVEAGSHLVVRIVGGAPVRVTLVDEPLVSVRSLSGTATFTSDVGVVDVTTNPADTVDIALPRDAPSIVVETDGDVRLRKDGGRVVTSAPDRGGVWFLAPGR